MTITSPAALRRHALLDYLLVATGVASPWLFGFAASTLATRYTLIVAAAGLGLNLATDYPGGLLKRLPFKWHRLAELASFPWFVVVPWFLFPKAGAAPWVLSGIGVAIIANAGTSPVAGDGDGR